MLFYDKINGTLHVKQFKINNFKNLIKVSFYIC